MNRFDATSLIAAALATLAVGCPGPQNQTPTATSGAAAPVATQAAVPAREITDDEMASLRANFNRVHFEYDSSVLDGDVRAALTENSAILLQHPDVTVRIQGHADHWGSDIYNLALGQRRADTVRTFLLDLGVGASQLTVISFGEERPLVGDGHRDSEAPNRRAEFEVTAGSERAASSY